MKSSGLIYVYVLLPVLLLTACVETIVMDPGEEDLPVMVNCIMNTDLKVQTLYLQFVKGKSQKEYIPITEAKVYVAAFFGTRTDTLYFHYVGENKWESDMASIIGGKRFDLTVDIPGRDLIHAETNGPLSYKLWSYTNLPEVNSIQEHVVYYEVMVNPQDKQEVWSSPVWVYAKGKLKTIEQCDEFYPLIVTDHPYADDFNINGQTFSDLPLEGEFDGYTMAIGWPAFHNMRRMYPNLPLHDRCVRIDHLDRNRFMILAGPVEYPKEQPHQDFFVFSFVSEEYDEYLRSVLAKGREEEHILTSIYSTEGAYSNIEGGVGIFGCADNFRIPFLNH